MPPGFTLGGRCVMKFLSLQRPSCRGRTINLGTGFTPRPRVLAGGGDRTVQGLTLSRDPAVGAVPPPIPSTVPSPPGAGLVPGHDAPGLTLPAKGVAPAGGPQRGTSMKPSCETSHSVQAAPLLHPPAPGTPGHVLTLPAHPARRHAPRHAEPTCRPRRPSTRGTGTSSPSPRASASTS